VARWQPGAAPRPGYLPLQWYDPAAQGFVDLPQQTGQALISSNGSGHE
jgi:hypothetical protein